MRANLTKQGREYQITSALTVGGRRKPRSRTIALTDCVCYDADGEVIRTIARNAPTTKVTRTRTPRTTVITTAQRRDIMLQATMGTIHSEQ